MIQNVPSSSLLSRFVAAVLRTVLAFAALLFVIGAFMLGIVLATGIVLWALLRGRRPGPVNLRWRSGLRRSSPRPAGEVVDVQVREVDPPAPR